MIDAEEKVDPADTLKLKEDADVSEATTTTTIPPLVVAPVGAGTLIEPPVVVFGVQVLPPPPPVELMVWLGQVPVMVTFVPATRLGVDVPVPP